MQESFFSVTIAPQNDKDMRTFEENYALLGQLVCEERIYLDPRYDFGSVCRLLGAGRREMDARLESELGLDGDALFAELRASFPALLESRYGLQSFFPNL